MRQLHVSALLGRVYWADAKENVVVGKKTDVTENFLGCVMQYFSNPEKAIIHDADGNEWKVSIEQTKKKEKEPAAAPQPDPFICMECGEELDTRDAWRTHLENRHEVEPDEPDEPVTAAPNTPPDQGQTEKAAALPSAEALTLANRGGGKAAAGDPEWLRMQDAEARQDNDRKVAVNNLRSMLVQKAKDVELTFKKMVGDPCEGCMYKDGNRCDEPTISSLYRFDERNFQKLPCDLFKAKVSD